MCPVRQTRYRVTASAWRLTTGATHARHIISGSIDPFLQGLPPISSSGAALQGEARALKGGGAHTLQGGARTLQAPTAAFLGEDCLDGKAWRALLSSGVLVVNVIGTETHVGHVLDTMRRCVHVHRDCVLDGLRACLDIENFRFFCELASCRGQ